jgi:glycosyltransferase involved in cell wall biosynthesis
MTERRALFVTTVASTLAAFLTPLSDMLRGQGWRVDALAADATAFPGLGLHFDERFDVAWSRNPLDPRNLIGSAGKVRAIVVAGGYDIVHVHTPIAAFVTRYALRSLPETTRPKVIYTAHGFHFYQGGRPVHNLTFRLFEQVAALWTDEIVTINAEDHAAAQSFGTIDAAHVHLIPGVGVDTSVYSPAAATPERAAAVRAGLGVSESAFLVAMIAEFGAVKRHELLFRALAKVRDPEIVVALAGEGPLEEHLRERAATLGIETRLRWAGQRDDIPELLVASDALVLVSEREGLNRSVLEAMATARPVIGTATRGIADAVGPDAGWIVAKHDVAALAAALDAAASDRAEAAHRGAAGRERVEALYALPLVLAAYQEVYRAALA